MSPSATVHTDDDTDQYRSHEQRDSYAQAHNVLIGFCKDMMTLYDVIMTLSLLPSNSTKNKTRIYNAWGKTIHMKSFNPTKWNLFSK